MLSGPLRRAEIPAGFLETYQTNFRFLVFDTARGQPSDDYVERVKFQLLHLKESKNPDVERNKIGGNPNWILEDESPGSYGGNTPMFFLLQLLDGLQFDLRDEAPRQIELGLDGLPKLSAARYYELFISNRIFLFGTSDRAHLGVYAITQVD
jgi:hypothetical protein